MQRILHRPYLFQFPFEILSMLLQWRQFNGRPTKLATTTGTIRLKDVHACAVSIYDIKGGSMHKVHGGPPKNG